MEYIYICIYIYGMYICFIFIIYITHNVYLICARKTLRYILAPCRLLSWGWCGAFLYELFLAAQLGQVNTDTIFGRMNIPNTRKHIFNIFGGSSKLDCQNHLQIFFKKHPKQHIYSPLNIPNRRPGWSGDPWYRWHQEDSWELQDHAQAPRGDGGDMGWTKMGTIFDRYWLSISRVSLYWVNQGQPGFSWMLSRDFPTGDAGQQVFNVPAVSGRFHFGLCVHTSSPGDTERLTWEPESSHPSHGVFRGHRCCQAPPPDVPRNACRWCEDQGGEKRGGWGRSTKTRERWDEYGDGWSLVTFEEKDWGHGESHPPPCRLWQTSGCDGRTAKFWQEGNCW